MLVYIEKTYVAECWIHSNFSCVNDLYVFPGVGAWWREIRAKTRSPPT